ncbi:MAG: preprotein translocase subunit YajC [Candidatus Omnitrophica bacterium]|nr:preprotein translocase subunit YajC [Candidatus Omnitrophota bacterium]
MNPNPLVNLFPVILIFFIMYFILIRPQKKQQRELEKMQGSLKKNDAVVTYGGIHGIVVNVKEGTVTVRVDDNVRLEVDKTAIARVEKQEQARLP